MSYSTASKGRVVALCGGIGGAKLALGLARVLAEDLTVIVNTGDDFEHFGLSISPDIDTVLYTLGDRADRARGWGRSQETWNFMAAWAELGGETWFQLGDLDLAMHIARTNYLRCGGTLTGFVAHVTRHFGIQSTIIPMCDDPIRTVIETSEGDLAFQRYFVERRCAPEVRAIQFDGLKEARPSEAVHEALLGANLRAIIICPSNPFLSIDPILASPGVRSILEQRSSAVVAVSPVINGKAIKGPTTKIMAELGVPATSQAIVDHYRGLIDGLILDDSDAAECKSTDVATMTTRTLMLDDVDRKRLARETLVFADRISLSVVRSQNMLNET